MCFAASAAVRHEVTLQYSYSYCRYRASKSSVSIQFNKSSFSCVNGGMNASLVCSSCRHRLFTKLRHNLPRQLILRVALFSLSNSRASTYDKPREDSQATKSEANLKDDGGKNSPHHDIKSGDDVRTSRNLPSVEYKDDARTTNNKAAFVTLSALKTAQDSLPEGTRKANRHVTRSGNAKINSTNSRLQRVSWNRSEGDPLEKLFQMQFTAPSTAIKAAKLEVYSHIETLKEMLKAPDRPIKDIWTFFVSNLGPLIWTANGKPTLRPFQFDAVARNLQRILKTARRDTRTLGEVPAITDIMSTYAALGLLKPGDWMGFTSDLLYKLSEEISAANQGSTAIDIHQDAKLNFLNMSEDLLGVWRLLFIFYSNSNELLHVSIGNEPRDWKFLPSISPNNLLKAKATEGISGLIHILLPGSPHSYRNSFGSMAFVTFALLTNRWTVEILPDIQQHPLVAIIARILSSAAITSEEIEESIKSSLLEDALNNMKIDWSLTLKTAESLEPRGSPLSGPKQSKILMPVARRTFAIPNSQQLSTKSKSHIKYPFLKNIHEELASALTERNLASANQLWEAAKQADALVDLNSTPKKSLENDSTVLSHGLCNHFILVYAGLGQPDRAIDVWNHMISVSLYPNLPTWNAMLEGCRRSKSITSLEGVWTRLLASGLQPDMVCWTTRISGLIECRKPKLAVRVLEEMGNNWIRAAKKKGIKDINNAGDIGGVLKPTIQMINAAIIGFLRRGERELANCVLAWGGKLGIKPDIVTFNTLLQSLVRDGRPDSIQALLKQMVEQGIQADVGTFTTILDEMFQTLNPESPEQQNEIINNVFAEMEATGVQANLHTYGKMIQLLLQSKSSDMSAATAVMRRMTAQGLQPSTHIYTLLVDRHFLERPPNLEAVRFLLDRIRLLKATVDHIFWSHVIIGYAQAGETAAALMILGKEDREGSRIGWHALQTLVVALVENREWDLARQVVRNITMDRGPPQLAYKEGAQAENRFWRAVTHLEIWPLEVSHHDTVQKI